MVGSGARVIVRLEAPRAGALVASAGDRVVPVRLVDSAGCEVVGPAPGISDRTQTRSASAVNAGESVDSRIVDPARLPFAYENALNAGNADAVLALFHQDATMRTFTGEVLTDQEALRAETVHSIGVQARLTNKPRFTQIGGDTALIIVDWNLEATLPDGTRISPTGTTTAVARRSADGSWQFAGLNCQGTAGSPQWRTTELPASGR
jgi:uncharacterized protein (TIGR02246 family)